MLIINFIPFFFFFISSGGSKWGKSETCAIVTVGMATRDARAEVLRGVIIAMLA